ncbi:MAG: type II secretion system protein GspE [Gammaproteobacteria bacterium]|nr:MAG: type II secretion system protein GspE [Gammaproteobacteria bacterium]
MPQQDLTSSVTDPGQNITLTRQDATALTEQPGTSDHFIRTLPYGFARRYGLVIDPNQPSSLYCRQDFNPTAMAEVFRTNGRILQPVFLTDEQFDALLQRIHAEGHTSSTQMAEELGEDLDLSQLVDELPEPTDLLESDDDAPIIRLINALFTEAIKRNASDIHIEPFEHRLAIRFRIDGVLREVLTPKREMAPLLVSRIKVMAKLDIAEKRLPQDGRISLRIAGRSVDVRVSTIPAGHGERVVLRLLDKQAGRLDLEQLGMAPRTLEQLDRLIHQPHGIILVTGPTGSGKTTTLYAALSRLNHPDRNIMTVEDPIEYYIDGISQTHVNTRANMSFAKGLRAILRQDPDIVMVGEIRDRETVDIAVQASLTGHLVLSTLHTNSAVGAITRLRDMGVEPFLLSSSLIGVLAQRLVRLLCPHCKVPHIMPPQECERYQIAEANPTIYQASGCSQCDHTGYIGRTGLYELIIIDAQMRSMIHDGASELLLEKQARTQTDSILQDGLRRVLQGDTSLEEVLRVTQVD